MWIFLVIIFGFSALFICAMAWLLNVISGNIPDDTVGRDDWRRGRGVSLSLWDRLRIWLTRKPARLDYRRDSKGRFRKVRRG